MKESTSEKRAATRIIADAMREAVRTLADEAREAKKVVATDAAQAVKVIESDNTGVSSFIYKQLSFGLSILGIVIGAFIYLTNPTKDNNTALQLQDQRISSQRITIDELTKTSQNDTQEVKAAVRDLVSQVNANNIAIEKLSVILQERLPANKNIE